MIYPVANLVIGLAFLNFTAALLVLFAKRRRDWPPAWALLLLVAAFGSCGLDRLVRAWAFWHHDLQEVVELEVSDVVVATLSLPCSFLAWFALRLILRSPTPQQIKELERKAASQEFVMAQAKENARIASVKAQQVDALRVMMSEYAHVDPALRDRMFAIVEGIK